MDIFSHHLQTTRKQAEPETLTWKPFIREALEFTGQNRIRSGRAMGDAPEKRHSFVAARDGAGPSAKQVTGLVPQDSSAEDR